MHVSGLASLPGPRCVVNPQRQRPPAAQVQAHRGGGRAGTRFLVSGLLAPWEDPGESLALALRVVAAEAAP